MSASGQPDRGGARARHRGPARGRGTHRRERDLRDLWAHTLRRGHEVADALVVIAEHAAGVTTTRPLCPAIATVLVFVARNAGKREVAP